MAAPDLQRVTVTPRGHYSCACSYCDYKVRNGRQWEAVHSEGKVHCCTMDALVQKGWQRDGDKGFLKPDASTPVTSCCCHYELRVDAARFAPGRDHRKTLKRRAGLLACSPRQPVAGTVMSQEEAISLARRRQHQHQQDAASVARRPGDTFAEPELDDLLREALDKAAAASGASDEAGGEAGVTRRPLEALRAAAAAEPAAEVPAAPAGVAGLRPSMRDDASLPGGGLEVNSRIKDRIRARRRALAASKPALPSRLRVRLRPATLTPDLHRLYALFNVFVHGKPPERFAAPGPVQSFLCATSLQPLAAEDCPESEIDYEWPVEELPTDAVPPTASGPRPSPGSGKRAKKKQRQAAHRHRSDAAAAAGGTAPPAAAGSISGGSISGESEPEPLLAAALGDLGGAEAAGWDLRHGFGSFHMDYIARVPAVPPVAAGAAGAEAAAADPVVWRDEVVAISAVDILPTQLISHYFAYHPCYRWLELGKLSAMVELRWVQLAQRHRRRMRWYNPCAFIPDPPCPQMGYKIRYRPCQLLCPATNTWQWVTPRVLRLLEDAESPRKFANLHPRGPAAREALRRCQARWLRVVQGMVPARRGGEAGDVAGAGAEAGASDVDLQDEGLGEAAFTFREPSLAELLPALQAYPEPAFLPPEAGGFGLEQGTVVQEHLRRARAVCVQYLVRAAGTGRVPGCFRVNTTGVVLASMRSEAQAISAELAGMERLMAALERSAGNGGAAHGAPADD